MTFKSCLFILKEFFDKSSYSVISSGLVELQTCSSVDVVAVVIAAAVVVVVASETRKVLRPFEGPSIIRFY